MSYPLGWSLTARIGVRRERWPGDFEMKCVPLVRPGEYVTSDRPVIRLERPAGTTLLLPPAPRFSLPVSIGQGLAGAAGNPWRGSSEVLIAGLRGTVVGITPRGSVLIESQVAIVSGTLGAGRQVAGPLIMWQAPGVARGRSYISPGAILVVPGPLSLDMLRQALYSGIAGIVASSIAVGDLESFLHVDLIELLNCPNPALLLPHLPHLTILLTEGLGALAMPVRTINLLSKYQGTNVLLSGATSVRARRYPELVISLPPNEVTPDWRAVIPDMELRPGALVRVCSGTYEGTLGEVNYLFMHRQTFPSGVRARAARLRMENGSQLIAPLQVLERIA